MSELKELIQAIAGLPHLAIWALVIFYGYKVAVIGSIYGTLRFVTTKVADVLQVKRGDPVVKAGKLSAVLCGGSESDLDALLREICNDRERARGNNTASTRLSFETYIHESDIAALREAYRAAKRAGGAA